MRKNVATLLIVLFSFFAVASLGLVGGIVRQWQALGVGAELAQATMVHNDKVRTILNRTDDFDSYRKISDQVITGRTSTLKGIAGLSEILHTNIGYFCLGLLLSLSGLLATGFAMYLRLRSCMQQLARADGQAAI
ncbi:hypothetical protein [Lysobacter terrae]